MLYKLVINAMFTPYNLCLNFVYSGNISSIQEALFAIFK